MERVHQRVVLLVEHHAHRLALRSSEVFEQSSNQPDSPSVSQSVSRTEKEDQRVVLLVEHHAHRLALRSSEASVGQAVIQSTSHTVIAQPKRVSCSLLPSHTSSPSNASCNAKAMDTALAKQHLTLFSQPVPPHESTPPHLGLGMLHELAQHDISHHTYQTDFD